MYDRGRNWQVNSPFDIGLAVERIGAAAQAARALPFPFILTARAQSLYAAPSLNETIRRLGPSKSRS
jgi:2-methylisocitrate lyase-like PEP mutase family enzyme